MNTHNICFSGEIRKILSGYPSCLELCIDLTYILLTAREQDEMNNRNKQNK